MKYFIVVYKTPDNNNWVDYNCMDFDIIDGGVLRIDFSLEKHLFIKNYDHFKVEKNY